MTISEAWIHLSLEFVHPGTTPNSVSKCMSFSLKTVWVRFLKLVPGQPELPQEHPPTGDLPLLCTFSFEGCWVWKWISTGKMRSSAGGSLVLNRLLRGSRTPGGSWEIGGNFKVFEAWRKLKNKTKTNMAGIQTRPPAGDKWHWSHWVSSTKSCWWAPMAEKWN